MKKIFLLNTVLFLIINSLTVAQVSKIEKKILSAIDANNVSALKLLEEAVSINSGTMNFEGVKKTGMLFKTRFDVLGFETKWVDGAPFNRAGHLIASHIGKGPGKTLLLIGHLDTVFEPSSLFQKFVLVNDSTASGPGASDMKGGNVIIVNALEALKQVGLLKTMNVIVVLNGDEESSGKPLALSKGDLIEAAKKADIAIGFEDADSDPTTAVVSRRGATGWELVVKGLPAHSSQIFTEKIGAGAIYETSRILNEFYVQLAGEKDLTFNPGVILGGTDVLYDKDKSGGTATGKENITARQAIVKGDIRAVSMEQLTKAQKIMQEIVSKNLPQTEATLTFAEGYPPLSPSEGNFQLLKMYSDVSEQLGYGPVAAVNPRNAGAADISFTAGFVYMAIDGLGLFGGNGHTDKEFANLNWLPRQTKRSAILLYRLSK